MRCKFCRIMDLGLLSGFCDTHKRGRINYGEAAQLRLMILAMCIATGATLHVEKTDRPELPQ